MAIIKPAKKFAGSDLTNRSSSKYIKEGFKQVLFNVPQNKDGLYLYILPPYKTDANGDGVWYKAIKIRDNFGEKFKEKYAVGPQDPADFFERNFKIHFPEDAKPVDEQDDTGRLRKRYPLYGRVTTRVIYNVGLVDDLSAGPHVLDLPSYMGASQLVEWLEKKDSRGRDMPMLNDPEACIPIFVKLKDGGSGNPWSIQPDPSNPAALPIELADSDSLYNLDDVIEYKSRADIIEKLREMYPPNVFELCMEGYSQPSVSVSVSRSPVQAEKLVSAKPESRAAPAIASMAQGDVPVEYLEDEIDMTPVTPTPVVKSRKPIAPPSRQAAIDFLQRKP